MIQLVSNTIADLLLCLSIQMVENHLLKQYVLGQKIVLGDTQYPLTVLIK